MWIEVFVFRLLSPISSGWERERLLDGNRRCFFIELIYPDWVIMKIILNKIWMNCQWSLFLFFSLCNVLSRLRLFSLFYYFFKSFQDDLKEPFYGLSSSIFTHSLLFLCHMYNSRSEFSWGFLKIKYNDLNQWFFLKKSIDLNHLILIIETLLILIAEFRC